MFYIISILLILPQVVMAYPNFIGKGYKACLTCHYNPYGNGALNDYGRSVSATAIADRLFVSQSTSEEDLANRSGFFFSKPSQKWLRPSLDYRGIQFEQNIDEAEPERRFIHMQMEANLTLKFGKRDQYIATFTQGVIPDNSARPMNGNDREELNFSREHYVGVRPINDLGIYLGKMDKVFGIRIPDHNAFSKKFTNLHQYSSSTGALIHWIYEDFEMGVQSFNGEGDIEKKEEEQTKGFTTKLEYALTDKDKTGLSYLSEKDINGKQKDLIALHSKIKIGNGSSLMLEAGNIKNTPKNSDSTTGTYVFMQNHILMSRGFYFLTTIQHYQPDIQNEYEFYSFSPGIQYFPWQRVEFRAELYNNRRFNSDESAPVNQDDWSFIGQLHLWF